MAWSGRAVDRIAAGILYVGLCVVVVWAGTALINHALESKFYKDFLVKWEIAAQRYRSVSGTWPIFDGTNHVRYMEGLVDYMKSKGIQLPRSNTKAPYTYVLDRIGFKKEDIFILCLSDRIIIYGLSQRTFEKADQYIDGSADPKRGRLRGKISKAGSTIIALWRI
ncbi:MAG: hypothetical protein JRH08_01340 [Deltaproteobacteria bacterium]|nr:hypothetical protein [Deltaproteobacteria bacterium]MBW1928416.1 hypothetical protein [Deltaproteobacteria bacterium]MBW2023785.1 hypothetical protein [Deltaproteobacteria bacterium]MBW2124344.1 hypothetical protein [Deltaproteobacteria bacterium]RLB24693.1 MAG: hypothetical protein DRG76_00625 [Deltaproteobacteria bacterium]